MTPLRQALDRLSENGLSYGVPQGGGLVIIYAGPHRVAYVPESGDWVGAGGQRGNGLAELIEGLRPFRLGGIVPTAERAAFGRHP